MRFGRMEMHGDVDFWLDGFILDSRFSFFGGCRKQRALAVFFLVGGVSVMDFLVNRKKIGEQICSNRF